MNAEILKTERLVLTPVEVNDLSSLIALWADEEFTRHITGRPLTSEEVWFRLLRDLGQWSVAGYGAWTVRLADNGSYLGSVSILDHRRLIDPPLTDPGFASEAVQAVLDWADVRLPAARTVCMIAPENLASVRLAERVGYRPYATTTYKDSTVQLFERPKQA